MVIFVPLKSVTVGKSKLHTDPTSTVLFAAQLMLGPVVSTTVTVWLHCELLLQASVASHVRVAVKVPPQLASVRFVVVFKMVMVTPLRSVAVGGSKVQA